MTLENKRTSERFSITLEAKVTHRHRTETPTVTTLTGNISNGGAYLQTQHPFPVAAKIQVEFLLDLESLKKLKFILSTETLKKLAQATDKEVWVTTTAIVLRRDSDGVAIIFDTNYTITPL